MRDRNCVAFLQWCLPRLNLRWEGFRKVRRQVCRRIARHLRATGLPDLDAFRLHLEAHPEAWADLDAMCRITISRFYRDRGVFDALGGVVLPALAAQAAAQGRAALRGWSAGCASGEEAYTLQIVWRERLAPAFPQLDLHFTATDADAHLLARARAGCYPRGTLKELPEAWRERAFTQSGAQHCIRPAYRGSITWLQEDIRAAMPAGPFDLILCRNLIFTYFDEPLQRRCLERLRRRLRPGGFLVVGGHEAVPEGAPGFEAADAPRRIYRHAAAPAR